MTPHSLLDGHEDGPVGNGFPSQTDGQAPSSQQTGSVHQLNVSNLRRTSPEEVHDLICVGFGPASLAVAVALHDAINHGSLPKSGDSSPSPKVLFLEKQDRFSWHSGMILPGTKMQISFIKDMASLRDPTSQFTFLNYLHRNDRLVEFTNLNTFLPARAEYEDYLRWCAGFFDDVVKYNTEVIAVAPVEVSDPAGSISTFTVTSRDVKSGTSTVHKARNVLIAIGGQPLLPKSLPADHPRVVHSSQYSHVVPNILSKPDSPYRVAIIGAGQSAAEIFNNIQTLYPNSKTFLVSRSEFLKPSDDSPFVNSIFNPSFVDALYQRSPEDRRFLLEDSRSTNYGVVRLELIERLYERMYDQKRELGSDARKWPHRILSATDVVSLDAKGDQLRLTVRPLGSGRYTVCGWAEEDAKHGADETETLDVDLVIAATGYQRQSHLTILQGVAGLLPEIKESNGSTASNGTAKASSAGIQDRALGVSRDYSVQFSPGKVSKGSGIWLQGCCEGTHGLSDTLLSVLAPRSGEIVKSIFGDNASKVSR
ncbi:L-lysine 6-monooxygenase (NADPH-requiring)-domain-containing protein [Durotheca rogersii]|uniref:L-lysine 6-monooxygenase (NADPH-requiring)-domain-containing protein n=1 Tax=Durotheca rogersii TaxID=419775 RepID=UPI00221F1292|nr:L-lysine 6-monooxygenase (NADPH-requiring)-domain-containing protein [Durotheca rogersii]KAI5859242.1 L-lysine 6-monooxygenase (NADPH-requiring)-domain-containing protein [Durotheca rogersii]